MIRGVPVTLPVVAAGRNSVAFHAGLGLYLIAQTGSPIQGCLFDAAGKVVGSSFNITDGSEGFTGWVGVTAGGTGSDLCWLVTYTADSGGTQTKYARLVRRVDFSTVTVSAPFLITNVQDEWFASEKAQSVWDATGGKFIVGTRKRVGTTNPQPVIHAVALDGTVTGGTNLGDEADYYGSPAMALASDGTGVVVGYAGGIPAGKAGGTYVRRFNASTLAALGSMQYAALHTAALQDQAVVYSGTQFVLLWWRDGHIDVRTMTVSGSLQATKSDLLQTTDAGDVIAFYNAGSGSILLGTKMAGAAYHVLELDTEGDLVDGSNTVLISPWDGSWPEFTPAMGVDPSKTGSWLVVVRESSGSPTVLVASTGVTDGDGQISGTHGVTVVSTGGSFDVPLGDEALVTLEIQVYPTKKSMGRLIHPIMGTFDYEVKPDEWVNIDKHDAIIPPLWASSRTLTSAANVLWDGVLQDVTAVERWKAPGGLSMPITQLRMLMAVWTNPLDPDIGYVRWYPNYITDMGFKVLPVMLSVGSQGVQFDDVVNYKDEDGEPIGWVTEPVTFQMKLVARL